MNALAWQIWGIELKLLGSTQDPDFTLKAQVAQENCLLTTTVRAV